MSVSNFVYCDFALHKAERGFQYRLRRGWLRRGWAPAAERPLIKDTISKYERRFMITPFGTITQKTNEAITAGPHAGNLKG